MQIIFFIFGLIFLIQLFLVLFTYGKMQDFHNYIDKKFMNLLSIFYVLKTQKNKITVYNIAINCLVASTIISLSYLDRYSIIGILLLVVSLVFYLFSISQIKNINIEVFEDKYLDEFIIALNIGMLFNFTNEIILKIYENQPIDKFSVLFLIIFVLILVFKLKHNKS